MEDRFATLQLEITKVEKVPNGSRSIAQLCRDWGLANQPQECLWVIAYDLNGNIRTVLEVARGGHAEMHVHIPSVLTAVLGTGALAFTVAHNHPTLSVVPSVSDKALTDSIMAAANACGLQFEEHLIVGPTGDHFSFVEAGLLIPVPRGGGKPLKIKRAAAARSGE